VGCHRSDGLGKSLNAFGAVRMFPSACTSRCARSIHSTAAQTRSAFTQPAILYRSYLIRAYSGRFGRMHDFFKTSRCSKSCVSRPSAGSRLRCFEAAPRLWSLFRSCPALQNRPAISNGDECPALLLPSQRCALDAIVQRSACIDRCSRFAASRFLNWCLMWAAFGFYLTHCPSNHATYLHSI